LFEAKAERLKKLWIDRHSPATARSILRIACFQNFFGKQVRVDDSNYAALFVYDRYRRGTTFGRLVPALALWLLFLPNAPYIVTDFVHLSPGGIPPLWFDGVLVSAFAWTGMLLGFVSLYLVHAVARHRFGDAVGWIGVVGVLALVSAGVFLGRVKRWNSWDVLTQPRSLLAQLHVSVTDPATLTKGVIVTCATTVALGLAYLVFYALMDARLARD